MFSFYNLSKYPPKFIKMSEFLKYESKKKVFHVYNNI